MKMFKNINFNKLKSGLSKTRSRIKDQIKETISGKAVVDEDLLEEIEEILITSDIGFELASKIIENSRKEILSNKDRSPANFYTILKKEIFKLIFNNSNLTTFEEKTKQFKPYVILVVGVNGAGKTTTIGKLAHNYVQSGLSVMIGSADTFRAAANEQLSIWAERAGVEIIQKDPGADPSSVTFETLTTAKNKNIDVVLIDTAGRLHTKKNLMDELKKIKRVMSKVLDYAPNETLLVVDGNTGQNAIIQADEFSKYTQLDGLIVTKLDGTAKGGIIIQISANKNLPIKFIGVGEQITDLQNFEAESFINALFE